MVFSRTIRIPKLLAASRHGTMEVRKAHPTLDPSRSLDSTSTEWSWHNHRILGQANPRSGNRCGCRGSANAEVVALCRSSRTRKKLLISQFSGRGELFRSTSWAHFAVDGHFYDVMLTPGISRTVSFWDFPGGERQVRTGTFWNMSFNVVMP